MNKKEFEFFLTDLIDGYKKLLNEKPKDIEKTLDGCIQTAEFIKEMVSNGDFDDN